LKRPRTAAALYRRGGAFRASASAAWRRHAGQRQSSSVLAAAVTRKGSAAHQQLPPSPQSNAVPQWAQERRREPASFEVTWRACARTALNARMSHGGSRIMPMADPWHFPGSLISWVLRARCSPLCAGCRRCSRPCARKKPARYHCQQRAPLWYPALVGLRNRDWRLAADRIERCDARLDGTDPRDEIAIRLIPPLRSTTLIF
jgi:hypothetical protein